MGSPCGKEVFVGAALASAQGNEGDNIGVKFLCVFYGAGASPAHTINNNNYLQPLRLPKE